MNGTRKPGRQRDARMPNDPLDWTSGPRKLPADAGLAQDASDAKTPGEAAPATATGPGELPPYSDTDIPMTEMKKGTNVEIVREIQRVSASIQAGRLSERLGVDGDVDGDAREVLAAVNGLLDTLTHANAAVVDNNAAVLSLLEANVMMADANYTITYVSPALMAMFERRETSLRCELPNFSARTLVGSSMDIFHKNPARQRGLLDQLGGKYVADISLGELRFKFNMAPLHDAQGKRSGIVVEWIDQTEQAQLNGMLQLMLKELNHMSAEHDRGEIDAFIPAEKFTGDFKTAVEGVNAMVSGHIAVKRKAMACVMEFANGNFDAELERFPGKKAFINEAIEVLRTNLKEVSTELQRLIAASAEGLLSERAAANRLKGDFAGIINGINGMLDEILHPIAEGNRVLRQISGGNLREKVEIECFGDHRNMKDAINGVHAWLSSLVEFVTELAKGNFAVDIAKASDHDQIHQWLYLLKNTIERVVLDATAMSQAIVDGELTQETDVTRYEGAYRKIIEAFEAAFVGLNSTFYQIVSRVEHVGQAAEQLNNASQNLASTSEEQSASVEEITASLEQTDSQVRANTDNATTANQLVIRTSDAASQGQAKMVALMSAMDSINNSSQSIAKIIKVIDEIAFQTNLLALNAAVEAARAGQHGRGFTVVAQEVRNLASRCAKAARETADLIEESIKRVDDGVTMASQTHDALNHIVTDVIKVKDLVAEITTASAEQSRGVSQINIAMGQVAKATQEGSQQAEELATSSRELANVSSQMRDEVRRFKLREQSVDHGALNLAGLESLTPEVLRQIQALLVRSQLSTGTAAGAPKPGSAARSPKAVIPLDQDERGFGSF